MTRCASITVITALTSATLLLGGCGMAEDVGSSPQAAETTTTTPLDDASLFPTPSVSPPDKATVQGPTAEPTQDWTKDWRTGVLREIEVPLGSVDFVANNGWSGYLGDQRITIAAGSPGYEHTNDGALFVATLRPQGGIAKWFIKTVDGAGAFTIQSGKDNAGLIITSASRQQFYYDLSAQTLTPQG